MKKGILLVSRVFAGSVFIISGLVKANDTVGFAIKLEEYFSADVLNLEFLSPYALVIATLVCVGEIVIGLGLLAGIQMKLISWLALLLTIFFAFLTFYSAYFEKVTDCGCFGDALKFTPWQSFIKDLVLMAFVLPIFVNRKSIKINQSPQDFVYFGASIVFIGLFSIYILHWSFPLYFAIVLFGVTGLIMSFVIGKAVDWIVLGFGFFLSLYFTDYTYNHLPIRDYRPYAIGKSIPDQMVIPPGEHADIFETTFVYRNISTGEEKNFTQQNYPWDDSNWEWVNTDNELIEKGYEPPVHDFVITDVDGYELQDDILVEENIVFLILFYDVTHSDTQYLQKVNAFAQAAEADGKYVYGLTASLYDELEEFRHDNQLAITFYSADETMLKTVIRSNPGIVMLKKGVVINKWHFNDLPEYSQLKKEID
jgi:uncharacterized membrane protein YphA (DoxX/SURF4 family)